MLSVARQTDLFLALKMSCADDAILSTGAGGQLPEVGEELFPGHVHVHVIEFLLW